MEEDENIADYKNFESDNVSTGVNVSNPIYSQKEENVSILFFFKT